MNSIYLQWTISQIVYYPIIFQGDYLKKNVSLPKAEYGDILIMHETGGYCMALYSKFNSVLPSPVYGYQRSEKEKELVEFFCFKEKETCKDTLVFWGLEEPKSI
jgi:hypothetical protein